MSLEITLRPDGLSSGPLRRSHSTMDTVPTISTPFHDRNDASWRHDDRLAHLLASAVDGRYYYGGAKGTGAVETNPGSEAESSGAAFRLSRRPVQSGCGRGCS